MTEGSAKEISTLKNKRSIISYDMLPDKCKFKWGKQGYEISKDDIDVFCQWGRMAFIR